MTTTYNQFTKAASSRKITLVHLHMKRQVRLFDTTGMLHTRTPTYFVTEVLVNGLSYTLSTGTPTANEFSYDPTTNLLTIFFDGDLEAQEVILTYRLFFSDYDVKQTHDLTTTGHVVHYKSRVKSVPGFRTELTFANSNKSIIGSGNLVLDNSDGVFHGLLKDYRFNNKQFAAYSWSDSLAFDEHQLVFRGIVHRGTLNNDELRFNIKDDIFNLNNTLQLEQFGTVNGVDLTNRFKKRVFGRVNGMRVQSTSLLGDGYELNGPVSGTFDSNQIVGVDGVNEFTLLLVPGDQLVFDDQTISVQSIESDFELTLTDTLDIGISNTLPRVKPIGVWYHNNRDFSISSKPLKEFSEPILGFTSNRRLQVADATGYEVGDEVFILNEAYTIDAISKIYTDSPTNSMTNDLVVLERTLSPNNFPPLNTPIIKRVIQDLKINGSSVFASDISISNTTSGCDVTLSDNAEFNIAPEIPVNSDITQVAGADNFILGTPSILDFILLNISIFGYRGSNFRLSKEDDTTTAEGDFVWFGRILETIPELTTAVANVTDFVTGDIYFDTDTDSYIGLRNAGTRLTATVLDMGSTEPIRLQFEDDITGQDPEELLFQILKRALINHNLWRAGSYGQANSRLLVLYTTKGISVPVPTFATFSTGLVQYVQVSYTPGDVPRRDINLSEFVGARDFMRVQGGNYVQVINAGESIVNTEVTFATTRTGEGYSRRPDYIEDNTLVTVNATGETKDDTLTGAWVQTPTDAIEKALIENNLGDFIDTASFIEGNILSNNTCGIYAPYSLTGSVPTLVDFVDKLTQTDLGSIGLDNSFNIRLKLLTGFTPSTLESIRLIRNNDLVGRAKQIVEPSSLFKYAVSQVISSYDFGEDNPDQKLFRKVDETLERLIDLSTQEEIDLYLPKLSETQFVTDRYLDYAQRLNRVVTMQGALSLSDVEIGDTVLLDLLEIREDRVNQPFLGLVTQVAKDGSGVSLRVEDFGELFFKSGTYAAEAIGTYAASATTDRLLNTFFTSDIDLVDNDESTFGQNIFV